MTGAERRLSSKRWLDRAAVWGLGAAVPVVCILGLWLLATARSHDHRATGAAGDVRGSSSVAAIPFDASTPPAIELKRATRAAPGATGEAAPLSATGQPEANDCTAHAARTATRPAADPQVRNRERPESRCAPH